MRWTKPNYTAEGLWMKYACLDGQCGYITTKVDDLADHMSAKHPPDRRLPKPIESRAQAKVPERSGLFWSREEDELVRRKFREGLSIEEIAQTQQRTEAAIAFRLERLGVDVDVTLYKREAVRVARRRYSAPDPELAAADGFDAGHSEDD